MKKTIIVTLAYLLPVVAFALSTLKDVICLVNEYLGYVVPLLFSIALVFFIIGIVKFFVGGTEALAEAKQMVMYGIIGLFVMFSVWGLVNVLLNTFSFDNRIPGLMGPGTQSSAPACSGGSSGNTLTNTVNSGTNTVNSGTNLVSPPANQIMTPNGYGNSVSNVI